MAEIAVRVLDESEWSLYREARLRALEESPGSFAASLVDEAERDEQFWRDRMIRSSRLLAERGTTIGIASVGPYATDPTSAELYGLYVMPDARSIGVASRLVDAAIALATERGYRRLYYWVGTDNARAIGFGKNVGFRTTGHRRPARPSDLDLGEQEMAMVMSLEPDVTSVPNPTSWTATIREGPTG
jgi:GNAT superfamily N-acetyltransferase